LFEIKQFEKIKKYIHVAKLETIHEERLGIIKKPPDINVRGLFLWIQSA
jgi:hypothetical protein